VSLLKLKFFKNFFEDFYDCGQQFLPFSKELFKHKNNSSLLSNCFKLRQKSSLLLGHSARISQNFVLFKKIEETKVMTIAFRKFYAKTSI